MSQKVLTESRSNNAYIKIYDASDVENFKLKINSNVLKSCKFSIQVNDKRISIVGQYKETSAGTANVQNISYDYDLPSDVEPSEVKTIESDYNIQIEAPRKH